MTLHIHSIRAWQAAAWLIEQEDGLILVDTGFPGNAERILATMREFNLFPCCCCVHST
jgi:glyoxylase-like metal-dependent hydrolase (beta-lactamase superfamily II)